MPPLLPQKKDNSLEAILETIRRGDEFDYDDIVTRVGDQLSDLITKNETISLCCDIIEVLMEHYKKYTLWAPLDLCVKAIEDRHDCHVNTTIRAIKTFHSGLKQQMKSNSNPERVDGLLEDLPMTWISFEAVHICMQDKTYAASKACIDLCETLAQTGAAKDVADYLIDEIGQDIERNTPSSLIEASYKASHLAPFTKSTNKKTAARAKRCLKDFFENFSPPQDQEEGAMPLLEDVRKQVMKLKL